METSVNEYSLHNSIENSYLERQKASESFQLVSSEDYLRNHIEVADFEKTVQTCNVLAKPKTRDSVSGNL